MLTSPVVPVLILLIIFTQTGTTVKEVHNRKKDKYNTKHTGSAYYREA